MAAPRRRLTQAEWTAIAPTGIEFPNLVPFAPDSQVWVTGEPDPLYNCFAWTLGREDRWLIPGLSIEKVDNYYVSYAEFDECTEEEADIDVWMAQDDDSDLEYVVKHFSRLNRTLGVWESKMGKCARITHPREALAGPSYGNIRAHYRIARPAPADLIRAPSAHGRLDQLAQDLAGVFPLLSTKFNDAYEGWWSLWPAIIPKADERPPTGLLQHDAYGAIVLNMGPRTLPLVVQKMQFSNHGPAVYIYERVMEDLKEYDFRVDEQSDVTNYIDWLNRMWKSVLLYLKLYESFLQGAEITRNAGGGLYDNIEEAIYDDGDNTGSRLTVSILPFIILEYRTHPSEPWDAILRRIVKKAPINAPNRDNYYKPWADWFAELSSTNNNAP
ncbi:hypothetical protein BDP27DRAFT_1426576 [Rhodocollybia butyracea]|uniref:DUF7689 domain-containing protein n=1 Tax=Rhodocollybia butyracea TaxID=206335 RepID=A0A9P5PI80_9AGAR|nr:hypothetical protein BDP27DRAFT_1426576 [Rhodocollybia butyracea]